MKDTSRETAREWQKSAMDIVDRCILNDEHNIIPVNACVGSGKTNVASYAFGKYIAEHIGEKTIQMFVTPRIKLCSQQADEIAGYIEDTFGLVRDRDFSVVRRDSSQRDMSFDGILGGSHTIIVICDDSLWGTDETKANSEFYRYDRMAKFLEKHEKLGYLLGNVAFDEAHNFTSKAELISK